MADEFEQGSIAAANCIFAWLGKTHGEAIQLSAIAAWNAGEMWNPAPTIELRATSPHVDETLIQPRMSAGAAKSQGFTGDACDHCASMRMKIAGHCTVCEDCGTTTGCS